MPSSLDAYLRLLAEGPCLVNVIDNHNGTGHRTQTEDVPLRFVELAVLKHLETHIGQQREALNDVWFLDRALLHQACSRLSHHLAVRTRRNHSKEIDERRLHDLTNEKQEETKKQNLDN
jgi:hypothetical protein